MFKINKKIKKILISFLIIFFLLLSNFTLIVTSKTYIIDTGSKQNNLSLKNLFNLDNLILNLMGKAHIPSLSACIIKKDEIVWSNSYGFSDIENSTKATINTAYLIASISKVVTATAVFQLAEQGLINISDNVNDKLDFEIYNPNYPDINITYEMLMAHKSSLNWAPYDFYEIYYDQDPPSLESWMYSYFYDENDELISDNWRNFEPGSKMKYSNMGYTLLGRLVEIISNMSFNKYCTEYIFKPLNMINSSFVYSTLEGVNFAKPYIYLEDKPYGLYIPLPLYSVCFYPAGGLWTTVEDLSHFLSAHMNKGEYKGERILNESSVSYMHENSLGWWTMEKILYTLEGHAGAMFGYLSSMYYIKNENIGIIIFINRNQLQDKISGIYNHLIELLIYLKAFSYKYGK